MMSSDDIKLILDPGETIRMILGKVRSCNRILSANGASKLISRDFRIGVRDGVMNFYSGRAVYAMCECSSNLTARHNILRFGDEAVRQMSHLSPSDLVRALGQWDSIGSWLDSLAVMVAEPEPDPAADLEAEDYLRARLVEARLR